MFTTEFIRICARCGKEFTTFSPKRKYCSDECKAGTNSCVQCGKFFIKKKGTTGKFCSLACWYQYNDNQNLKNCPVCGKKFSAKDGQKTCSVLCGHAHLISPLLERTCGYCHKLFLVKPKKAGQRFCSNYCATKSTARRKIAETRKLDSNGYIILFVGTEYTGTSRRWIPEHRYVMEQKLGRKLISGEYVHHIDGDKTNNNIENLELWVTPHLKGIKAFDLIKSLLPSLTQEQRRELLI